jgi:uncharacterized membrane protein YqaE (UPF0057 family)
MKKFTFLFLMTGLLSSVALTASVPVSDPVVVSSKTDPAVTKDKDVVLNDVVATDALREFKSLTRVERKMRIAEAKKAVKEFKAQKAAGAAPSTNTLLLVILAILLPPLAVYLHEGVINGKFWLDLLLTLLFFLPGVIYALIVVLG